MMNHEERLRALIVTELYTTEAEYHAQVETFRRWLRQSELAMADEGIPESIIEKVLNRMVFGVPDSADAWRRNDLRQRQLDLMKRAATPRGWTSGPDLLSPTGAKP